MKKGQITFFILIGIVILIAFSLSLLFLRNYEIPTEPVESIVPYVTSCLEYSGKDAIRYLSLHGGYLEPPDSINIYGRDITVLLNEQNLVPSKFLLEEQLSIQTELYFEECVDFSKFFGDITTGTPEVSVNLAGRTVFFDLDYPMTIVYEEAVKTPNKFSAVVDARMLYVFNEINKSIEMMDGMYNMTHLENLDFETKVFDYEDSMIFDFKDDIVHVVFAVRD